MRNAPLPVVVAVLGILTLLCAVAALCIGRFGVSPADTAKALANALGADFDLPRNVQNVITNIRLPRIIAAIFIGLALSVSGCAYQGIFKNVLVSPDLLGVSAGACVGACLAIIFDMQIWGIQALAFGFGLGAVALTLFIPHLMRRQSTIMLVLSGIIVSALMASIIGFFKYIADPETKLPDIVYWQLGSLSKISVPNLLTLCPLIALCVAIIWLMAWRINLLSLGDVAATRLGVNVPFERGVIIICATLLTASSVCLSGIVAWVGLLIPHLARMSVGVDNTRAVPASLFLGAIFVLVVDTIARTISPSEVPLGVLTGFIGTLFFIWVLFKSRGVA